MTNNIIYIPARYKSKRFPGKLLKKIKAKTILEYISEKVKNIKYEPIIVSGDKKIISFAKKKNIKTFKSKKKHISGMSRVSEVINDQSPQIIYILFGDELFLSEKNITDFIRNVKKTKRGSCWHLLTNIKIADKYDRNVVKCKINQKSEIIDFQRNYKKKYDYKCVGLFAFRKKVLKNYSELKSSETELKMKVEQFKLLENGVKINSMIIENILNSINSIKDLKQKKK